jgi:hypothetical protein
MREGAFDDGAVCMPLLGPREAAKRRRFGLACGALTALWGVGLLLVGASRWERATVFVPAALAAYGLLQAREKT